MTEPVKATSDAQTKTDAKPQEETQQAAEQKVADKLFEKEPEEIKTKTSDEKTEEKSEETKALELKLPENSLLSPVHLEKVKEIAKELNLTSEQAQARLEQDHSLVVDFVTNPDVRKHHAELAKAEWLKQTESDKEIGGTKLAESIDLANLAVNKFGSTALKKMLTEDGFGNHPEFIRFASKMGRLMKNDELVQGQTKPSPKPERVADRMFDS